jgi:ribonuclease R
VQPFGLFVELADHYVEGLVHVSTMADDYYRFVEASHTLFGERTKRVFRLGDRVRVQIVKVDMSRRQIELGIEDLLDAVRTGERSRGPRRSAAKPKRDERKGTPQERRTRKTQRIGRRERGAKRRP